MVQRAYKFRLYPNREQQEYFSKCFGSVRFLYNKMLAERIALYEEYGSDKDHKPKTYSDWKKEYDWLYEIDNLALANCQIQLRTAYANFFRDKRVGFPKFRSKKHHRDSYTTYNQGNNIRIENGKVKLPKIGWVKVVESRKIPGAAKIKSCTISRTPSGKYFISMLLELPIDPPTPELDKTKALGLDYSSPHFYVDSQGNEANYPKFYRNAESKLAREQRKLSRMKKGSGNYVKQRIRVARYHEHVASCRNDWLHKESRRLADEWDYICVEDINLRGMAGSLKLGKSTNDNGFGMFREYLNYKLVDRGKKFVKIDRWFPSSKTCCVCGYINDELTLSDREWDCCCGTHHIRDINAAINIRNEGIRIVQ